MRVNWSYRFTDVYVLSTKRSVYLMQHIDKGIRILYMQRAGRKRDTEKVVNSYRV